MASEGAAADFFRTPAGMTALPDHPALATLPTDLDELRRVVQNLLVHRDWATAYGLTGAAIRLPEQNLRSTSEVLARAFELSAEPVAVARPPAQRVLGICRHFTLVHTAFLRAQGVPARVRCGFSNYFDRSKWYDHWITERWDGQRWIRDDPQIDALQAAVIKPDFDPYDQPPGQFLTGGEAWSAVRAGSVDPNLFGIFDMWGHAFIAGNVLADIACLNKVELLPWDSWGIGNEWGPHDTLSEDLCALIDGLAELSRDDRFDDLRERYLTDDRIRVPRQIVTFIDGLPRAVSLEL